MSDRKYNVLFLCTGNTARSILAEAYLNQAGRERFKAHSAGSKPGSAVHPRALALLQKHRIPTDGLRSKNWNEFSSPGAEHMDIVITVCDAAAAEPCPYWPGQPMTAHWGVPDPAAVQGNEEEQQRAFVQAYTTLSNRINLMLSLPLEKLDRLTIEQKLKEIAST